MIDQLPLWQENFLCRVAGYPEEHKRNLRSFRNIAPAMIRAVTHRAVFFDMPKNINSLAIF
jgi:hypothetical protein